MTTHISDSIRYIGCDDYSLDLFESKYPLSHGVAYNSHLILDEKCAVIDTMDARCSEEWLTKLDTERGGRQIDYLIISHMEPDHAASISLLVERHPSLTIVGTAKALAMLPLYFALPESTEQLAVADSDTLSLGNHTLRFLTAPMVHWPEVMISYEETEHVLFSADAFGRFGTLDHEQEWEDEARRYYYNIVGKYGAQVQTLLAKVAPLDIRVIASLHGPLLTDNLGYYIGKYDAWSRYQPEEKGVLIVCASIYGNTLRATQRLAEILEKEHSTTTKIIDLTRHDSSAALAEAFRYEKMVVAASTYDGGIFTPMDNFLQQLAQKGYRSRRVGIVENGSWAPMAARRMREILESMRDISICNDVVTLRGALKECYEEVLHSLAAQLQEGNI